MKVSFLLLLFIGYIFTIQAQESTEFYPAKSSLYIPAQFTNTTADLASYIILHTSSEKEKALVIYQWVTSNIRYSTDSANALNMGGNEEAKVSVAFRRKKGVCENFAAIFNDIALRCGLTSFTVKGYTKQSGSLDKTGHTWCAARIEKRWQLFDPTWDEGRDDQYRYFMISPQQFIETHMPYDPLWQLLDYPISNSQFVHSLYKNNHGEVFNYNDSLEAYLRMDSLTRYKSIAARMQKDNFNNVLLKNHYGLVKMEIEMIHQEEDVDHYSSAVSDLNAASSILNNFIVYRNNKFMPLVTDIKLANLLSGIELKLHNAIMTLDKIDRSEAKFAIGTWKVREQISKLELRASEQQDFLEKYINTELSLRPSLFYTSIARKLASN